MSPLIRYIRRIISIPVIVVGILMVVVGGLLTLGFGGQMGLNIVRFMFSSTGDPDQGGMLARAGLAFLLAIVSIIVAGIGTQIGRWGYMLGAWPPPGDEQRSKESNPISPSPNSPKNNEEKPGGP
jgi:hypothetical protein